MKHGLHHHTLRLFVIIALASVGALAQTSRGALDGVRWNLTHLNGERAGSARAFLEIERGQQNRFTGNAGCNRMFGEVDIDGRAIRFGRAGTTRINCPGAMRRESEFLGALERTTRFRIDGRVLTLYARRRAVLRFEAAAAETPPNGVRLEDRKWMLETIGGRALPKIETTPFIVFDAAKRSAGGDTGCNVFGGNYAASGSSLKISDVFSTMRACIEDARMDVERDFKNALDRTTRYEIKDGKLHLYRHNALLLTFRGERK